MPGVIPSTQSALRRLDLFWPVEVGSGAPRPWKESDLGSDAMAQAMFELALQQPGCLGAESARGADGLGITVAYFADETAILAWKENARHRTAQRLGKER